MEERRPIDMAGAGALVGFAALLAFNQVVVKVTAGGFAPVFQAGLRSAGAIFVVLGWIVLTRVPVRVPRVAIFWGVLSGVVFALEFMCLFIAIDRTSVARASVIFYSMPVWLALASHFLLPGERLNGIRFLGLVSAMAGVAIALVTRAGGSADWGGDVLALIAALGWAAIALLIRVTPLSTVRFEVQLLFQVAVSAVVLLPLAPLFGAPIREVAPLHYAGLAFQIVFVAGLGFLMWFRLMTIYQASGVASFAFLSPVLAVVFGWSLLGEQILAQVWVALVLVALGIFLINRQEPIRFRRRSL